MVDDVSKRMIKFCKYTTLLYAVVNTLQCNTCQQLFFLCNNNNNYNYNYNNLKTIKQRKIKKDLDLLRSVL